MTHLWNLGINERII